MALTSTSPTIPLSRPPRIYKALAPPVKLAECSIFSQVLNTPFENDTPVFIDAETKRSLTLGDLRKKSLELAWGIRNVLHSTYNGPRLTRGDTVLFFSVNTIVYPLVVLGLFAGGLRASLANSAYTPRELLHQYADSGSKLLLCHADLVSTALEMFKLAGVSETEAKSRIVVADYQLKAKAPKGFLSMEALLGKGSLKVEENFDGARSHETTLLCYSSGTTGKPKGVETTHRNLTSVIKIVESGFPVIHRRDSNIGVLPFYHIYGCMNMLYTTWKGVPTIVMTRFEPVAFCRSIGEYKTTFAFLVPPILVVLSRHEAVDKYDMSSLERVVSGAAPLSASLTKAVVDRLKGRGAQTKIVQGYGLTETSPSSHILDVKEAERKMGSIGRMLPNLEARLIGEDDLDVPEGERGELWLRGPTIMKGYHNNATATRDSITSDGWFKTGDVAMIDSEHFFYIVDRKKELIKYKGFQVPPAELEGVLLQHPDISDVGVVGVHSHEEATEYPRAYVVCLKTLSSPSETKAFCTSVQKWIQSRVARHKFLRGGVIVVDIIPKSPAGKILRRQLRDRARKEFEAEELLLKSAAAPKAKL